MLLRSLSIITASTVIAIGVFTGSMWVAGLCVENKKPVNALTGPKDSPYMENLPQHRCTTGDICHVVGINFYMEKNKPYYLVRIQKPDSNDVEIIQFEKHLCTVLADLKEGEPIRVEHTSQRVYKPGRVSNIERTRKVVIHVKDVWDIKDDIR